MLRTGKIKVNGKKKDQTYKIEDGDEITLWMSDEEIEGLRDSLTPQPLLLQRGGANPGTPSPHGEGRGEDISILYEDEYLMVLDKPAGLNVHS